MRDFPNEFADMARALQNFCDAVANRKAMSIGEAVSMLEGIHAEEAPIEAMARVVAAQLQDEPDEARFWNEVYSAMIAPQSGTAGLTFH